MDIRKIDEFYPLPNWEIPNYRACLEARRAERLMAWIKSINRQFPVPVERGFLLGGPKLPLTPSLG
jgi:hypothetical protein